MIGIIMWVFITLAALGAHWADGKINGKGKGK